MEDKQEILNSLEIHKKQVVSLINAFEALDKSDDKLLNRLIVNNIAITLFELIDTLVNTEIDTYNYLHRRG
uniref:Uncharacterized protein n=1 Tax=viral metagenome TaxID=1070528 RepID=A0A6M3LAG2_9ZZZZ